MLWFTVGRLVIWVKRLALAAERQAEALETLARIEQDRAHPAPRPRGKFISGQLNLDETNKIWRKRYPSDDDASA